MANCYCLAEICMNKTLRFVELGIQIFLLFKAGANLFYLLFVISHNYNL